MDHPRCLLNRKHSIDHPECLLEPKVPYRPPWVPFPRRKPLRPPRVHSQAEDLFRGESTSPVHLEPKVFHSLHSPKTFGRFSIRPPRVHSQAEDLWEPPWRLPVPKALHGPPWVPIPEPKVFHRPPGVHSQTEDLWKPPWCLFLNRKHSIDHPGCISKQKTFGNHLGCLPELKVLYRPPKVPS